MNNSFTKKKIVVSAVNLTEGGGRSILISVLNALAQDTRFIVIAMVNNRLAGDLIRATNIKYVSIPCAKKSWINRLLYEYIVSKGISKRLNPDIWFSLHDITPNVITKKRYVYCHNISPFYKFRFSDIMLDYKFSIFVLLYKYIYKINIKKNQSVFVQQCWIAERLVEYFDVNNCVVALPEEVKEVNRSNFYSESNFCQGNGVTFFYPTLPRTYKNLEIIFRSVCILRYKKVSGYKVFVTVSEGENKYIENLVQKYGKLNEIIFCGRLNREEMNKMYSSSDVLLFTSKLETWGLPIREAMEFNLPVLLANHPYSQATSYGYDKVAFFDAESPQELSSIMNNIVTHHDYDIFKANNHVPDCDKKFQKLYNWDMLLDHIYKS
jgi:glycosyltransferase involved in cell wall biosynthesis